VGVGAEAEAGDKAEAGDEAEDASCLMCSKMRFR
jgi:hypothetical protein